MMNLSDHAIPAVSKAIMVTGSARSGTTIMGKIIHSLEGVEYAFEPPMMFSLFALSLQIPEESWRLLYETYLYEEFMLNTLAGRAINCNRADDSSIYNVKSAGDINARLGRSLSKADAEELTRYHSVAFKLPDVVPFIPRLIERYPATRVVIMLRGAVETLNSLLKKRWFSYENNRSALIWPFRKHQNVYVPFWVQEEDDELWVGLSELNRAAYYYIRVNEDVDKIKGRIEVKYAQLVAEPRKVVDDLAGLLGLSFGAMTEAIIAQICPTNPARDEDIIERIAPEFREKIKYYSARSN